MNLDLMHLDTWQRFEAFCCHLARDQFPNAFNTRAPWDGGRDIQVWNPLGEGTGDVVWQCKFTEDLGTSTRNSIKESLERVQLHYEQTSRRLEEAMAADEDYARILKQSASARGQTVRAPTLAKWVLCIPVTSTAPFRDWLRATLSAYPFAWDLWDAPRLLEMLERRPDVLHRYFFRVYAELRDRFQHDDLELLRFDLDTSFEQDWQQRDERVLDFHRSKNNCDPELVLDVVLRNRGTLDTVVTAVSARVKWLQWKPHGIPSDGLLRSKAVIPISIGRGRDGTYRTRCPTPIVVPRQSVQRFHVALRDTGYAWRGTVQIEIEFGAGKTLAFPSIGLYV